MKSRYSVLHSALGQTGPVRDRAEASGHAAPSAAPSLPIQIKVNKKSGGLSIVTDQIWEQDIENVVIDRDGCAKPRHD